MNAQKAAETTMAVVKELKAMRAALESERRDRAEAEQGHGTRAADATRAASLGRSPSGSTSTTATTRCSRGGWAMPFKQLDTALQEYATFLREKVAAADAQAPRDAGERAGRDAGARAEVRVGA